MRKLNPQNKTERSIADKFSHAFYKLLFEKSRESKRCMLDRDEYREIQREMFRTISDEFVNDEGGVYIDHFGYLCHVIKPERRISISKNSGCILRSSTNGHLYRHVCLDFFPTGQFYHMSINFTETVKERCRLMSKRGFVYKFNFSEVKHFIANFASKRLQALKLD